MRINFFVFSAIVFSMLASVIPAQSQHVRTIHVFVALCDNENQGIVPVPATLGKGTDPAHNLYWGALYGVKTYFSSSRFWRMISAIPNPQSAIMERLIFKHDSANVFLVADAWRGDKIKKTITDFLKASAGYSKDTLSVNLNAQQIKLPVGGAANLLAYAGHDGLMDFDISPVPQKQDEKERETIVLACMSKNYFAPLFAITGAKPLLLTTGLMAPEAYTLAAALQGWIRNESAYEIRMRAARSYKKYQKCSLRAAQNLFSN